MNSKTEEQSWHSCKSSIGYLPIKIHFSPIEEGGEPTQLDHKPVYVAFSCKRKEVLDSGVYNTAIIPVSDSPLEVARLFNLPDMLNRVQFDVESLQRLENKIRKGLVICNFCKFYEQKK